MKNQSTSRLADSGKVPALKVGVNIASLATIFLPFPSRKLCEN